MPPILLLFLLGGGVLLVAKAASAKPAAPPTPQRPALPMPGPSGCYSMPAYGGTGTDLSDMPPTQREVFETALAKSTDAVGLAGVATTLDCLGYGKAAQRFRDRAAALGAGDGRTVPAVIAPGTDRSFAPSTDASVDTLPEPLRTAVTKAMASPLATADDLKKLADQLEGEGYKTAANQVRTAAAAKSGGLTPVPTSAAERPTEGPTYTVSTPGSGPSLSLAPSGGTPGGFLAAPSVTDPLGGLDATLRGVVERALSASKDPDALDALADSLPEPAKSYVHRRAQALRDALAGAAAVDAASKLKVSLPVDALPEPLRTQTLALLASSFTKSKDLRVAAGDLMAQGYTVASNQVNEAANKLALKEWGDSDF